MEMVEVNLGMIQRKRIFAICMALMLCVFSPMAVFADETKNAVPISITSGLVFDESIQDPTFQSSRVIYGEALPFSEVCVDIFRKDGSGNMLNTYNQELQVGSMGIFSMTLPLELGTNYIELTASCEGFDETTHSFQISRKSQKVKEQLKGMVALLGSIEK